jgi:hypothetical protein
MLCVNERELVSALVGTAPAENRDASGMSHWHTPINDDLRNEVTQLANRTKCGSRKMGGAKGADLLISGCVRRLQSHYEPK